MSRIGKVSIKIPSQVEVYIENQSIQVSGPHGRLCRSLSPLMEVKKENQEIMVVAKNTSRQARELHGLSRTLIQNMILGVSTKFERQLEMKGVGYRSVVKNKELVLNLGYSHPVVLEIPEEIEVKVESNVNILIQGIDKEKVGQLAARIRSKRPPEPYKGKGILYKGEVIKRKVGKSGK